VQNDIIAQLTREMRLNGGGGGHLSGGSDVESSTGSTSTLNNPAATADKIAALALQARMTNVGSPPVGLGINTSASSGIPVPVSKLGKTAGLVDPQQRKSPIKQQQQQQLVSQASVIHQPTHSAANSSVISRLSDQTFYVNEESYAKQQQLQQQQQHEQQKLQQQQQQQQQKQQQEQQNQMQQQQQTNIFKQQPSAVMNGGGSKPDNLPPLLFSSSQSELPPAVNSNSNISKTSNSNWSKSPLHLYQAEYRIGFADVMPDIFRNSYRYRNVICGMLSRGIVVFRSWIRRIRIFFSDSDPNPDPY
jgi:hypothetical protein